MQRQCKQMSNSNPYMTRDAKIHFFCLSIKSNLCYNRPWRQTHFFSASGFVFVRLLIILFMYVCALQPMSLFFFKQTFSLITP